MVQSSQKLNKVKGCLVYEKTHPILEFYIRKMPFFFYKTNYIKVDIIVIEILKKSMNV